jgi:phage terminase large subunit GpA-like protein
MINGREVWSVIPMKGANSVNSQRLSVVYPDTSSRKNKGASKGTVPVAMFNPNLFKDDLNGQLQRAGGGNWAVHFPHELRSAEEPHEWFEQLVSETRDAAGKWEKIASHARNEALDLMCMTHSIAHLHGISSLNWNRPPPWAAPLEHNTFLVKAENVALPEKKDNNVTQEVQTQGVKVIVASGKKKSSFIDKLA